MTTAAYDAIAEWYDRSIREKALLSADDLIAAAVLAAVGDVTGRLICDLACGQGDMARRLARRGARVVEVDISRKLLEIARREEEAEPLGVRYYHADAQALPPLGAEPFGGVLCSLALMDIPDLTAMSASIGRLLRPGAWFVFSITHPCFQVPPGRPYHEEGFWRSDNPNGVRGQVGAHHRTLGTYLSALGDAGLLVEHFAEPRLPNRPTPPVLVARCRKIERT
jgi:ubiquinone/menaquinone biosynthesis C-methylase UbiE